MKISSYDIYLARDCFEKDNISDNQLKEQLEYYTDKLQDNEYVKINRENPIIAYVLEAYKSEINLQMIQNSILWSIFNIKNNQKLQLEFLYKMVMLEKLKAKRWNDKSENKLILKLLKDNKELYEYIIFTQDMNEYMEDVECKKHIKQKLKSHLEK